MLIHETGEEYVLKKALMLDIPQIFDLMMYESERGTFSERFTGRTGSLKMFLFIFIGIIFGRDWPSRFSLRACWLIVERRQEPLGFMTVVTLEPSRAKPRKELSLLALQESYRGKGHGKKALQVFVRSLQEGSTAVAYCPKYSRPMKALLKAVGFSRNLKSAFKLEEYVLVVPTGLNTPR